MAKKRRGTPDPRSEWESARARSLFRARPNLADREAAMRLMRNGEIPRRTDTGARGEPVLIGGFPLASSREARETSSRARPGRLYGGGPGSGEGWTLAARSRSATKGTRS